MRTERGCLMRAGLGVSLPPGLSAPCHSAAPCAPPQAPLLTRGAVCLLFRPLQLVPIVPIDRLLSFHFLF